MRARLFCQHCDKYYEVKLKHIRVMQALHGEHISFAHNTYFYKSGGCFFKTLNSIDKIL